LNSFLSLAKRGKKKETRTMPTIKLYANLRNIAETKELSITLLSGMPHSTSRGASLGQVLNELVQQIPALDGVILENGQIRSHFVITINGINATDLNVVVMDQDSIAIFPPIAGG
jgi:molybdopterin synthase sulfur carrier subunit